MNIIDIIIIFLLVIILGLIIYFCFWKNRKKPCFGCPYARNCENQKCQTKLKDNKKDTL